ncbi:MAG: hypothetical protein LBS12_08010 [Prevotellaceae bacterium]|jgi:hypothetical protein|nr:hypothetical protein [Prevotellaceae bacterium]
MKFFTGTHLLLWLILYGITAQALAQTPQALHAALPAIAGWTVAPEIEVFNRENLYERINGAAPLFFENNFEEMTSMVYTRGEEYITIQAYRHATPEDAFGMYASERSSDMTFYPGIGGEAQGDAYGLFFFAGCIYVKMSAGSEGEAVSRAFTEIAAGLAAAIDTAAAYPPLFTIFPAEGLIAYTQAYISQNYIGHAFLKPACTANYTRAGLSFQAFVIDGKSPEAARQILLDYFRFTGQPTDFTQGNLLIEDRYNGNIPVVWQGRYIIGAFSENADDFPEEIYGFLREVAAGRGSR